MFDVCEHCGALFLKIKAELRLVELEDFYGLWHEWLCGSCLDDLAQLVHEEHSTVVRFSVYDWDFRNLRDRPAS